MSLLLLSLLPLFAGPLVVRLLQSARGAARGLDGFVVVSIAGLVSLHVLPHALAEGGVGALAALVVGLLIPDVGGRLFARGRGGFRQVTFAVGLVALALHATLDGVALAGHQEHGAEEHDALLGLAVVLHRIPVGLAIWWLLRPRWGLKVAWAAVGAIAASTVVGYGWAATSDDAFSSGAWAVFQALVAGSLLHVVIGHVAPSEEDRGVWRPASAGGGLLAVVCLWLLSAAPADGHDHAAGLHAVEAFWALATQAAWPTLLAVLVVSLAWGGWRTLPPFPESRPDGSGVSWAQRLWCSAAWLLVATAQNRRGYGLQVARAAIFRAFPPSSVAPALGASALLISLWLLGPQVAALRLAVTSLAALSLVAWRWLYRPAQSGVASCSCGRSPVGGASEGRSWWGQLALFQDALVPRLVFGVLLAALVEALLNPARVQELGLAGNLAALAGLGSLFSICGVGSLPLMAVLLHKGFSLGAVMAFFYASAAASLYLSWFRSPAPRRVVVLLVAQTAVAVALGWVIDCLMPGHHGSALHEVLHQSPGMWLTVGVVGLGGLLALSLFRGGVEGLLGEGVPLSFGGHHHHWAAHPPKTRQAGRGDRAVSSDS